MNLPCWGGNSSVVSDLTSGTLNSSAGETIRRLRLSLVCLIRLTVKSWDAFLTFTPFTCNYNTSAFDHSNLIMKHLILGHVSKCIEYTISSLAWQCQLGQALIYLFDLCRPVTVSGVQSSPPLHNGRWNGCSQSHSCAPGSCKAMPLWW